MRKSRARKFVVLLLLAQSLFFLTVGTLAQESGGTFEGDVTYEQYLETSPEDSSYEAYVKWKAGKMSKDIIDCRSVCSDACAPHRTLYQYYIRDTCWW